MPDPYRAGLAWLHGRLRQHFGQSETVATIERRAVVRSGYADTTPTWDVIAVGVPVLVRTLKAEAVALQGRDAAKAWVRIEFLGSDPGVARQDRITIGPRRYSVETTVDRGHAGTIYHVDCTEIRG